MSLKFTYLHSISPFNTEFKYIVILILTGSENREINHHGVMRTVKDLKSEQEENIPKRTRFYSLNT